MKEWDYFHNVRTNWFVVNWYYIEFKSGWSCIAGSLDRGAATKAEASVPLARIIVSSILSCWFVKQWKIATDQQKMSWITFLQNPCNRQTEQITF